MAFVYTPELLKVYTLARNAREIRVGIFTMSHDEIFWTAVAAVGGVLGQIVHTAYRFGQMSAQIQALSARVDRLCAILDRYVKL